MALDLFRVIDGIAIQHDDQSVESHILNGNGAPIGTTGRTADAPIGSMFTQTDTEANKLNLYWKHASTNSPTDWVQAATKEYVDTAVQGISWREPAIVQDAVSTTIPVGVAGNPILVDGISITDGERVLFSNQTIAGDNNVWVYNQAAGTFSEDVQAETDGDAILINEGTSADEQWIYDGTNWIQFGGAGSSAELSNIRDYVGKPTAGNVFPQYQSNNILADNDDLTAAAGKLDLHVGDAAYTSNNIVTDFVPNYTNSAPTDWAGQTGDNITQAISAIDSQFGDGNITPTGGNSALSADLNWGVGGSLTITTAFDEINTAIGDRSYTNDFAVTDGESVAASIDALDSALGDGDNSSAYTAGGLLDATTLAANNVQENIDSINQEVGDLSEQNYENTVTNFTILTELESGTLSTGTATEVLWHVQVKINGDGSRRHSFLVHAMTDGTNVDWTRSAILKLGTSVGNLNINVSISTGNWSLTMNPVNTIDATIKRYSYSLLT